MPDTPQDELMADAGERAQVEELTRQADRTPAIVRFREVLAFVGGGRRSTQAGKLTPAEAVALARQLGMPEVDDVRSMEDLPEVAHVVHWALAAGMLSARATRIVPGPRSGDLERDPLAAWVSAASALFEHGLLDGFRRGWRKSYVELLDAEAPALLRAISNAGGSVPFAAIEGDCWEHVARAYDYELGDDAERQYVRRLVHGIVAQLADLGAATHEHHGVVLTDLGKALAAAAIDLDGDYDVS